MSVPEETLQQIEEERQKLIGQKSSIAEEEVHEEREDADEDEPNTQDPELDGFMTYEEYIEAGYDPEFYRGPKAYKQQKQILAEKKQVEQKLKKIDDQMLKLTKFHEKEKARLIKEIEAQQKQAKEDIDFDRFEELERQKRELEQKEEASQEGEHPAIAEFRQDNPKYDPRSPEYDPVDEAAFKAAYNAMVNDHYKRTGEVRDEDIVRLLNKARQRFEGGPQRQTPKARVEAPKRKPKKESPTEKMPPEVKDLYERWSKSTNPDKQAAAKQLLKQHGES